MHQTFLCVTYNSKKYGIIELLYRGVKIPVLMDYNDMNAIKKFGKKWTCSSQGYVYCVHNFDGVEKEVCLHEVIMGIINNENGKPPNNTHVVHINKIGFDNRRENLMYDVINKDTNKNFKKKVRIISLPEESGIKPNDLPTYVWYLKPNGSHGERFFVEVGDFNWKTTSSRKVSLRYKLEEAKTCLRNLKITRPDLFDDYSMNGEYTKNGKILLASFYKIIYKYGYSHIKQIDVHNLTDKYLRPANINHKEKKLLDNLTIGTDPNRPTNRRDPIAVVPESLNCDVMPKYCYYHAKSGDRGDYFVVRGHPAQNGPGNQNGGWKTTSSKKVTTPQKFKSAVQFIKLLENNKYCQT